MKTTWNKQPGVYSLEAYRHNGIWCRADNDDPIVGECTLLALSDALTSDDTVELVVHFWSNGFRETPEYAGAFSDGQPEYWDETRELHCVKVEGVRLNDEWAKQIFDELFDEIESLQMD